LIVQHYLTRLLYSYVVSSGYTITGTVLVNAYSEILVVFTLSSSMNIILRYWNQTASHCVGLCCKAYCRSVWWQHMRWRVSARARCYFWFIGPNVTEAPQACTGSWYDMCRTWLTVFRNVRVVDQREILTGASDSFMTFCTLIYIYIYIYILLPSWQSSTIIHRQLS